MKIHKKILINLCVLLVTGTFISCSDDNGAGPSNPVLYPSFEAESQSISTGESIEFKDQSVGNPSAWEWSFEGGSPSTSTEQNPIVTYNDSGEYDVSLTIFKGTDSSNITEEDYISVISETPDGYLTEHTVAYYPFDGSAEDAGPNGIDAHNMENVTNVTFDGTDRGGNENNAVVFNGSNALIIPDHSAFNTVLASDFSISTWIKTEEKGQMMVWQEAGSDDGMSVNRQGFMRIGDNDAFIHILLRNDDKIDRMKYSGDNASTLSDGDWHHVVTTREGANSRIYVDGEKKVEISGTTPQINFATNWDFKIGVQQKIGGDYGNYFSGSIDDFVIYDKALTDQEVADLYEQ